MQPLYLVEVLLSIFQWLQMALFAVFLGLLKFVSNVRTLTLYSQKSLFWKYKLRKCNRVNQTFKNCSRSSLWAQGFSGCYSLFFFFCEWNYAWKTFLLRKFTQVGSLYNLIICMKEEREGSPSVKTQLHFYCEKVHLSWFTNKVVLTCMKGKFYGMIT